MKVLKLLTLIFTVLFFVFCFAKDRIVINPTASMPIGVYWRTDKPLERGDVVLACLPNNTIGKLFLERGYLYGISCGDSKGKILKQIVGIPGDKVVINQFGITINGKRIETSMPQHIDSQGRKMPLGKVEKVLEVDEYILMGRHPLSLDSRYLGTFSRKQILFPVRYLGLSYKTNSAVLFTEL